MSPPTLDAPLMPPAREQRAWFPFRLRKGGEGWVVDWCELGGGCLEEPFFDQAIARRLRECPEALCSTPVNSLAELSALPPARGPGGFIFHTSRCGSTLISWMLSAVGRFAVVSEPALLETLLRGRDFPAGLDAERRVWLRGALHALLTRRADGHAAFLKLTARAISDHAQITAACPELPCVFVYREPVEVLVSLVGGRADRLPPGLERAGLLDEDPELVRHLRPAEFWARVLARQCAAALEALCSSQLLLLNYQQLPAAVWESLSSFWGIDLSPGDVERMRQVARRSAKNPEMPFAEDRTSKRQAATDEIHEFAERWVRPHYDRLEALRTRCPVSPEGRAPE